MKIEQLREYFKNKIKTSKGFYNISPSEIGKCYDLGPNCVQLQLNKLIKDKKYGKQKIYYLKIESFKNQNNLSLVSEDIYIDKPTY